MGIEHDIVCIDCFCVLIFHGRCIVIVCASVYEFRGRNSVKEGRM